MSDKTEEATPKRLRKAREEGDSGVSTFASQSAGLLVASLLVPAAVTLAASRMSSELRSALAAAADASPDARFDAMSLAIDVTVVTAPLLFAVGMTAAVVSLVQTGGAFSPGKMAPKLDRLNVLNGLKELVSATKLLSLARALLFCAGRGLDVRTYTCPAHGRSGGDRGATSSCRAAGGDAGGGAAAKCGDGGRGAGARRCGW